MSKKLEQREYEAELIKVLDGDTIDDILIEEGHAYDYHGGKKKDFKKEIQKEKEESKLVKGNKDD